MYLYKERVNKVKAVLEAMTAAELVAVHNDFCERAWYDVPGPVDVDAIAEFVVDNDEDFRNAYIREALYVPMRVIMEEEGGNIGWCSPHFSGRVVCAAAEHHLAGLQIDGEDVEPTVENIWRAARIVNEDADEYRGWDARHVLLEGLKEGDCRDCPWFGVCDAMDN